MEMEIDDPAPFDNESEILAELLDFILTLLHNVVFHRAGLSRDRFFFAQMYGLRFPICHQPAVAKYIESCAKKIVGLLAAGFLDGFQIEFYERNQAVQRYIAVIDGNLQQLIDSKNEIGVQNLASEIHGEARRLLLQYNEVLLQIPKPGIDPNQPNITRFKITLGVEREAIKTSTYLKEGLSFPDNDDEDSCPFPWSKPKTKITCRDVDTQFKKKAPVIKEPHTPTKDRQEQDEVLTNDLFFIKTPGSFGTPSIPKAPVVVSSTAMTPPLKDFCQNYRIEPSPITPITKAVAKLKAPALFPVDTIEFGSITFCFYVLTYYRKKAVPPVRHGKSVVRSPSASSLMSPSNLSSPGLSKAHVQLSGRENQLLNHTPPGIGKPLVTKESSGGRIIKSSRSLVTSFQNSQSSPSPRTKLKLATSWSEFRSRYNSSTP